MGCGPSKALAYLLMPVHGRSLHGGEGNAASPFHVSRQSRLEQRFCASLYERRIFL